MDDSELTRKAIAELMKEMDDRKENENLPTERKKNPLGKPNKLFLGRTINSMMKHNKRQTDRNLQRCERKLKELDARKAKHEKLKYSHEISSDSSNERYVKKSRKKKKSKRRKKRYRTRSSSSSSTSSSSSVTDSSSSSNSSKRSKLRKSRKKRHKIIKKEDDQDIYNACTSEPTMGYYVDPNMAYAVMAYNQMSHIMQQQQLQQQVMVDKDLEESIEIPSDLSISYYSSAESSLNISLHSSSVEEDENGVITFKLSSDDEANVSNNLQDVNINATHKSKEIVLSIESDDKDSTHSHISVESKESQKSVLKETKEIYVLSSSDSDELEIIETIPANSSK